MVDALSNIMEQVKFRDVDAVKLLDELYCCPEITNAVEKRSFLLAGSSVFLKCWEEFCYGLLPIPKHVVVACKASVLKSLNLSVSSRGIWLGGELDVSDEITGTSERQLLSVILVVGSAMIEDDDLLGKCLKTLTSLFRTTSDYVSILFPNDDKMLTSSLAILRNEHSFRDTIFNVERVIAFIFIRTSFNTQTVIIWLRAQLAAISLLKRFITRITATNADFSSWKNRLTSIDSEIQSDRERGFWVEDERCSPDFVLLLSESQYNSKVQSYPLFAKDAVYGHVDGFQIEKEQDLYTRFVILFKELHEILVDLVSAFHYIPYIQIEERPKGVNDPLVKVLLQFEAKHKEVI